jgi:hypothetical protein
MLDDVEEQEYRGQIHAGCQKFNQTLSSMLSILHDDICPAS